MEKERYLYLIKFQNLTKIGISINPEKRLKQLNLGKEGIVLWKKQFPSILQVEKSLHNLYEDKRVSGEWYDLTEDEIEEIKYIDFPDLC